LASGGGSRCVGRKKYRDELEPANSNTEFRPKGGAKKESRGTQREASLKNGLRLEETSPAGREGRKANECFWRGTGRWHISKKNQVVRIREMPQAHAQKKESLRAKQRIVITQREGGGFDRDLPGWKDMSNTAATQVSLVAGGKREGDTRGKGGWVLLFKSKIRGKIERKKKEDQTQKKMRQKISPGVQGGVKTPKKSRKKKKLLFLSHTRH